MRVLALCFLAAPLLGQVGSERAVQDPAELLRAKLASPFLYHADWTTDYDEAKRIAKQRGQLIFGYFTTAGY